MDHHKVKVTLLQEMKLKPGGSRRGNMLLKLRTDILAESNFAWDSENDAFIAQEININAKIDEELFYYQCMKKTVIIYYSTDE